MMQFRAVAATIGVAVAVQLHAAASQTDVPPKWISGDSEPEGPVPG